MSIYNDPKILIIIGFVWLASSLRYGKFDEDHSLGSILVGAFNATLLLEQVWERRSIFRSNLGQFKQRRATILLEVIPK